MNIEIPGFKTSRDFPSKNKLIIRYLNKHRLDIFKYFRIFSIYTFYFLQSLSKNLIIHIFCYLNESNQYSLNYQSYFHKSVKRHYEYP